MAKFYYADKEFFAHKKEATDHLKRDGCSIGAKLHSITLIDRYEIVDFLNALCHFVDADGVEHEPVLTPQPELTDKQTQDLQGAARIDIHGNNWDEIEKIVPEFIKKTIAQRSTPQ